MRRLKKSRAIDLLEKFQNTKILVVGDLMLDEFLWGRARRIAPEAPVPIVEIERETLHIGGAGNVAANLAALGAKPIIIGVQGNDINGERLCGEFEKAGIDTSSITIDSLRPTTVKTRIIAHSQHVVRADREKKTPVNSEVESELINNFLRLLPSAQGVIVSDYEKGVITPSLLEKILPSAVAQNIPVCIDPKLKKFEHYHPATIVTPNQNEAEAASGITIDSEENLALVGKKLRQMLEGASVLITRGEEGMSLFENDNEVVNVPTIAREVYDVTGAGDTVVATLALGLACGASMLESAILANYAAGVVVAKVGTATASAKEVLDEIDNFFHHNVAD
ncbi:MAG: D-glycero-beta-D-manno-heptose-7-phosphate kinase [Acidobacteria bacterium]|nr:D-glycero-beta-D-manno-heptose-7-phosphate kinase [Acidobacteriota bacterium]